MRDYEYMGIIGHDHCGSTVLCRLLATIPGVESGGELHWLLDAPPQGTVAMRAGWPVSRSCAVHGEECAVFTADFVAGLVDPSTLYAIARERLAAEILVSTDKYPGHFERHVPPGEMLGVVLFKHPYAAVTSDVLTNHRGFGAALDSWATDYEAIVTWAPRFCHQVIWQSYEVFACAPAATLERIAAALGREVPGGAGGLATDYHFIGGNAPARARSHIAVDERWRTFLDAEKRSRIDDHDGARRVLTMLEERAQ
jgi:hypothetical protein